MRSAATWIVAITALLAACSRGSSPENDVATRHCGLFSMELEAMQADVDHLGTESGEIWKASRERLLHAFAGREYLMGCQLCADVRQDDAARAACIERRSAMRDAVLRLRWEEGAARPSVDDVKGRFGAARALVSGASAPGR